MAKNIWQVLEIDPTTDTKIIKRAYAKLLKQIDMNDVQAFQTLKAAFDQARKEANTQQQTSIDESQMVNIDLQTDYQQVEDQLNFDEIRILNKPLVAYAKQFALCNDQQMVRQFIIEINQLDLDDYAKAITGLFYYISTAPENYDIHTLKSLCDELNNVDSDMALVFYKRLNELPKFPFYKDEQFEDYHHLRLETFNSIKAFEFADAQKHIEVLQTDYKQFSNEVNTLNIMLEIIKQQVTKSPKQALITQLDLSRQLLVENPNNQTLVCCFLYLSYMTDDCVFRGGRLELSENQTKYEIEIDLEKMEYNYLAHDSIYVLAAYQIKKHIVDLNDKTKAQVKAFHEQRIQELSEQKLTKPNKKGNRLVLSLIVIIVLFLIAMLLLF